MYKGNEIIEQPLAGSVLVVTLNSWRYFSALSALAMLFTLVMLLTDSYSSVILAIASLVGLACQYYCWRLWLDCHLFTIFYQHLQQSDIFDSAINQCWGRKEGSQRSLISRWHGARRLLYLAASSMLIQWGIILILMIVHGF
jgi:hypothetical protein